ncbi:hypothetical protein KGM_207399 [Danaus plexippus plexippus]|uniref:Uncharacterized protein n=1 Tax=Danaus plexippus plexippus TaxID=278856 RepID=A0A212FPF8_DANPL|nr:hypothetical protein KGM_207399 [Danaus plexippus plexippus]
MERYYKSRGKNAHALKRLHFVNCNTQQTNICQCQLQADISLHPEAVGEPARQGTSQQGGRNHTSFAEDAVAGIVGCMQLARRPSAPSGVSDKNKMILHRETERVRRVHTSYS